MEHGVLRVGNASRIRLRQIGDIGGPRRIRTLDLRIKSPLHHYRKVAMEVG
jgi:hypothetical protein